MKQRLVDIMRRTGVIYFSDFIRYRITYLFAHSKNAAFLKQHAHEAFPEPYMIYETFKMDYERYFLSGRETAEWIVQEVSAFMPLEQASILDWGCGPGRVVRHLPAVLGSQASIFGSDYNPSYVAWCKSHLKSISFTKNELLPPLHFPDKTFDLAYALSIFTHLSEPSHQLWMQEIMRVLKPGGIFFFTTHGDVTREHLLPEEIQRYNAGTLVLRANVKEGHRMYVAYHPPSFVQQLFGSFATLLKHQPGVRQPWGAQQDTWIIRKH